MYRLGVTNILFSDDRSPCKSTTDTENNEEDGEINVNLAHRDHIDSENITKEEYNVTEGSYHKIQAQEFAKQIDTWWYSMVNKLGTNIQTAADQVSQSTENLIFDNEIFNSKKVEVDGQDEEKITSHISSSLTEDYCN